MTIKHVRVAANGSRYTTSEAIAKADGLTILAQEPAVDRFGRPLPPESEPVKAATPPEPEPESEAAPKTTNPPAGNGDRGKK